MQFGLSTFVFDRDNNSYFADTYVFYLFPRPFLDDNRKFVCKASSFQFLCDHDFDFNKVEITALPHILRY